MGCGRKRWRRRCSGTFIFEGEGGREGGLCARVVVEGGEKEGEGEK